MKNKALKRPRCNQNADDWDSDSNDTVILADDEPAQESCDKHQSGISFIRFISFDNAAPNGGIVPTTSTDVPAPKLSTLPSGLSFLQSHPGLISGPSLPAGSFMFTDCRHMTVDEMHVQVPTPFSESLESSDCSVQGLSTVPPTISPQNVRPVLIRPANVSPNSFKDGHLLDDLRSKNREAARKCRQKKKNYIQKLERDYKDLKVCCCLLIVLARRLVSNKVPFLGKACHLPTGKRRSQEVYIPPPWYGLHPT